MDSERMRGLHSARSQFVEQANENLPEAKKGKVEELKERYKAVTERMAKYVAHHQYPPTEEFGLRTQHSAARFVERLDGPMPNVYVRFNYSYNCEGDDTYSDRRGTGLNEHGENIQYVVFEWIHTLDYESISEPRMDSSDIPVDTQYGEVFATESLSINDLNLLRDEHLDDEGSVNLWGFHPSVKLDLIEQSLDQYEAAPASSYELREGLVQQ